MPDDTPGVTLTEALALPAFRRAAPRVVAAAGATDRPIRWVHATERPDVGALLREGDLLLTMGTGLPDDAAGLAGVRRRAGRGRERGARRRARPPVDPRAAPRPGDRLRASRPPARRPRPGDPLRRAGAGGRRAGRRPPAHRAARGPAGPRDLHRASASPRPARSRSSRPCSGSPAGRWWWRTPSTARSTTSPAPTTRAASSTAGRRARAASRSPGARGGTPSTAGWSPGSAPPTGRGDAW